MTNTMTRSLIETLVRSKLNALKESPERTTRNLVDMALHFSTGRFQIRFFEIAQEMLQNEKSMYYHFIHRIVSNVATDKLLCFGMNVGYNSFTYGAKIIRKLETKSGYNIPWNITIELNADTFLNHQNYYHKLLDEGKSLGIYTWSIFSHGQLQHFLPILEMNTDCAFLLFCSPSEITEELLEKIESLNNIMFVVKYDDYKTDVFSTLNSKNLLYSTYIFYDDNDISDILNGEYLCSLNATNSIFAFFLPNESCSPKVQELVYKYALETRNDPIYDTLPFDFLSDNQRIDSIISDDSCSAWFHQDGTLFDELNFFTHSLSDILKAAFPKSSHSEMC